MHAFQDLAARYITQLEKQGSTVARCSNRKHAHRLWLDRYLLPEGTRLVIYLSDVVYADTARLPNFNGG